MKLLFSALATIDYDGVKYYNNNVVSQVNRYLPFCSSMICLAYKRTVEKSSQECIEGNIDFRFLDKTNSLKSLIIGNRVNKEIIHKAVQEVDACIVHVFSMYCGEVIKAARKYNKPYCTVVVGCPWDAYWNYNFKGKLIAPLNYWTLRKIQKNSQYSIYVTERFLQSRYPTQGISTNCSNVEIPPLEKAVVEARHRFLNSLNTRQYINIATVAALDVKYKGQQYVIKALEYLKISGLTNYRYHLIGSGDNSRLKELARKLQVEELIVFHGPKPHHEVLQLLDSIDIYIQPSKQEGLPRALIEAMSRGCLCIGSNIAGIPELLPKRYLFEKGNAKQIARILQNITIDEIKEQSDRNFKVSGKYSNKIINDRRNSFLNEFFGSIEL